MRWLKAGDDDPCFFGTMDRQTAPLLRAPRPGGTVFVVDDDAAVLSSLQFVLEVEGFDVRLFGSRDRLLQEAEFPREGCLIVDHHLKEGDGLEALAQLRARGVKLPAILIVGSGDDAVRRRAARAGVSIVEKPLMRGVVAAIHDALGNRRWAGRGS